VVETNARALIEVLRGIPRNRHVCLEEGTLSGWLWEVLEPHVEELVVTGVHESRGPKSEGTDAKRWSGCLRAGGAAPDRFAGDGGVQGAGPGEEPAEERAPLAGRVARQGALGLREGGEGMALLAEARKHREWHVLTVIGRAEDEPLYRHYERLVEAGTKPNLAKLTLARQIAAIALAVWRSGEAYDPKRLEATE